MLISGHSFWVSPEKQMIFSVSEIHSSYPQETAVLFTLEKVLVGIWEYEPSISPLLYFKAEQMLSRDGRQEGSSSNLPR